MMGNEFVQKRTEFLDVFTVPKAVGFHGMISLTASSDSEVAKRDLNLVEHIHSLVDCSCVRHPHITCVRRRDLFYTGNLEKDLQRVILACSGESEPDFSRKPWELNGYFGYFRPRRRGDKTEVEIRFAILGYKNSGTCTLRLLASQYNILDSFPLVSLEPFLSSIGILQCTGSDLSRPRPDPVQH